MAVGADQFALRDLVENSLAPKSAQDHHAHLTTLGVAREMIPVHSGVMERATTVGARLAVLHGSIPGEKGLPVLLAHADALVTRPAPVRGVVLLPTSFAPGLTNCLASMERVQRLLLSTPATSPCHVVMLDSTADDKITPITAHG